MVEFKFIKAMGNGTMDRYVEWGCLSQSFRGCNNVSIARVLLLVCFEKQK